MIHKDKLEALLKNPKLPPSDVPKVGEALKRHKHWISQLDSLKFSGEELLKEMIRLLNEYKFFIEYNLIFCSPNDFLYRQKGQLKLDNTVLEEFLPRLVDERLVSSLKQYENLEIGASKMLCWFILW